MLTLTPSPIRVAIADPCPVMHRGLIEIIEADPHVRVVATASHRHDLLPQLHTTTAHVLVIDLVDMGEAPVPLLREIKHIHPALSVVVFSTVIDFVPELRAAGAIGYVAKKERVDQLGLAIRAAKVDQCYLSPLVQEFVDHYDVPADRHRLSRKELLTLTYIAQGLSNEEIRLRMDIELHSVENRVSNIKKKIGIENRVEMGAWYRSLYGDAGGPKPPLRLSTPNQCQVM